MIEADNYADFDHDDSHDIDTQAIDQTPPEYKAKIHKWKQQERMKIAISFYYENVLHDELQSGILKINGKGSVYGKVSFALNLSQTHYTTVKTVIDETIYAIEKGEMYQPYHRQ